MSDNRLGVYFDVEGSPEPVGWVHTECAHLVPGNEDGMDVVLDGSVSSTVEALPCMYHDDGVA